MDPDVKSALVAALRGGGYRQGRGALRRGPEGDSLYCCLGVLCDLHLRSTGRGVWLEPLTDDWRYSTDGEFPVVSVLPEAVARWAGFPFEPEHPMYGVNPEIDDISLVVYNDGRGPDGFGERGQWALTFPELADLIEGSDL